MNKTKCKEFKDHEVNKINYIEVAMYLKDKYTCVKCGKQISPKEIQEYDGADFHD